MIKEFRPENLHYGARISSVLGWFQFENSPPLIWAPPPNINQPKIIKTECGFYGITASFLLIFLSHSEYVAMSVHYNGADRRQVGIFVRLSSKELMIHNACKSLASS